MTTPLRYPSKALREEIEMERLQIKNLIKSDHEHLNDNLSTKKFIRNNSKFGTRFTESKKLSMYKRSKLQSSLSKSKLSVINNRFFKYENISTLIKESIINIEPNSIQDYKLFFEDIRLADIDKGEANHSIWSGDDIQLLPYSISRKLEIFENLNHEKHLPPKFYFKNRFVFSFSF